LQTIAKLFEGDPQRTGADRIQCIDNEFIFTARRVNRELAARADLQAVRGTKTNAYVRRAKALGAQLCVLVLEREVPVAGRVIFEV